MNALSVAVNVNQPIETDIVDSPLLMIAFDGKGHVAGEDARAATGDDAFQDPIRMRQKVAFLDVS